MCLVVVQQVERARGQITSILFKINRHRRRNQINLSLIYMREREKDTTIKLLPRWSEWRLSYSAEMPRGAAAPWQRRE